MFCKTIAQKMEKNRKNKIFFCINIIGRLDSVIDKHTHLTDTKLDLPIRKIGMPIIYSKTVTLCH